MDMIYSGGRMPPLMPVVINPYRPKDIDSSSPALIRPGPLPLMIFREYGTVLDIS